MVPSAFASLVASFLKDEYEDSPTLASSLGLSKQLTGSYQAGLLIFAGLAFVALLGVSLVRKRWNAWSLRPAQRQDGKLAEVQA